MMIYVISVKKAEGKYGMGSAFRHEDHKNRDIRKLYNSLALRLVFIADVVAMLLPFLFIARFYYEDRMYEAFNFRGNWLIILLFVVVYLLSASAYQVFQIQILRIQEVVYSQALALIVTDFVMFIIIWLVNLAFPNILPMLLVLALQMCLAVLWAYLSHKWYFYRFKPAKTLIVYDMRKGEVDKLLKRDGLDVRFNVVKICHISELEEQGEIVFRGIETVFLSGVHSHNRNQVLKYCTEKDITAYVIPRIGDVIMSGGQRIYMMNLPMVKVSRYNPAHEYRFIKRVLDVVFSCIILGVMSPLMLVVAIIIKATDGGSVFYKQTRITMHGRRFKILKFRSMKPDAEKNGAQLSSGHNDSRVTSVGRFIRRYRIDELPQFINVIKGDMAIVGPRPERPEIARVYESKLPEFSLRLQVRAGITGYAQIYSKYNTSPYDKLLLDLMYISKPNLADDIRIMFATLKTVFIKESTDGMDDTTLNTGDISDINAFFSKETELEEDD